MCLSAQITSGTPLVWHFIEYQRQDVSSCFGSPAKKSSLKLFYGAFFCLFFLSGSNCPRQIFFVQLHIFMFFSFNSTLRFAILSCFNPAETFDFASRHICLHSRPRKESHKCARALFGSQGITLFRSELLDHLRYTEDLVPRVFSPRASN